MSIMGNLMNGAGIHNRFVKCNKCGKEYNVQLTTEELDKFNAGVSLQEIFKNKSELISEQATLGLCNDCYTTYHKEKKS